MPQKEIRQPPCWWGGNTKTDGIKGHIIKVYFVWVKEKSQVTNLKDNKSKITPLLGGIQGSWGCPFLFLFLFTVGLRVKCWQENLPAHWEHKYVSTWASRPPFPVPFPPEVVMIGSTLRHWRVMFASQGIWLPNLLNKQAVEGTAQSKQRRRMLRKALEIFNSFLAVLSLFLHQPGRHGPTVDIWNADVVPNLTVFVSV